MSTLPPEPPAAGEEPPTPQNPQYSAPTPGPADPVNNIQLNYWLSVFFTWIPALIFWVIEKDKGNQRATEFHAANFNFSLLRLAVGVAAGIIALIPFLGWIIAILLWIGSIVLFIFHLMAAISAAGNYRSGKAPSFPFNITLVK